MAKIPNQKSMRYDQYDYMKLMESNIPASLVETRHFDSAEDASVFFARELDYVKSQSYDVEYPELTALSLFPMSSEVDPGAETVTYYSYDKVGLAKIISNYATDLPRADVKGKPTTAIIKSLGASYGYSIQEMRASAMAGKSLDTRKAESARYQIDYLNNKIAWCGDEETGLRGVLSKDTDVPLYVLANGAKGSTKWSEKTEDEILADINGMLKQMARTTRHAGPALRSLPGAPGPPYRGHGHHRPELHPGEPEGHQGNRLLPGAGPRQRGHQPLRQGDRRPGRHAPVQERRPEADRGEPAALHAVPRPDRGPGDGGPLRGPDRRRPHLLPHVPADWCRRLLIPAPPGAPRRGPRYFCLKGA